MSINIRNQFDFAGNGTIGTATKNTTTNIDFKLPAKLWLDGGAILTKDPVFGDWFQVQIVDVDNILGGGAGQVLKNYINKWYIHPDISLLELNGSYAGEVLKDLYIRIKYHSIGTVTDVTVAINYKLHALT